MLLILFRLILNDCVMVLQYDMFGFPVDSIYIKNPLALTDNLVKRPKGVTAKILDYYVFEKSSFCFYSFYQYLYKIAVSKETSSLYDVFYSLEPLIAVSHSDDYNLSHFAAYVTCGVYRDSEFNPLFPSWSLLKIVSNKHYAAWLLYRICCYVYKDDNPFSLGYIERALVKP